MSSDLNEYGDPVSLACEQERHEDCIWKHCKCYCHKEPREDENNKGDGK